MFQFYALDGQQFRHYFHLNPQELDAANAQIVVADAHPGYPCRVTLSDAEPGERLLLVNYSHLTAVSPYRSSHAIFVSESGAFAEQKHTVLANTVPNIVLNRPHISLRAFDDQHLMIDARLCAGGESASLIEEMLSNEPCQYLHVHSAARGCYFARVERS